MSTFIDKNSTIDRDVRLGQRCTVRAGVRLGDRGFGYQWLDNRWVTRDHPYGVRIGDRVDIGANTVINRGRWRHTRIGNGTKVGALVFVAHNVEIGRDCLIVDHANFGGSATIGNEAIIGLGATILPHITVGDRAIIGSGAVVTKDVPAGEVWAGNPARKLRDRLEGETI